MHLDPTVRDGIVIGAAVLSLVAVVVALMALRRFRLMHRELELLAAGDDAPTFVAAVTRHVERVDALRGEVDEVAALLDRTRTELGDALRHVSVVRYDAFGDMGGRLSFSAALLDDGGDGLVLTSIHARAETRSYVKGIKAGGGGVQLSPEEQQAISYALKGVVE
ncbi:MAG TPA: DUF4446 family protein [Candidatus Nanopelagicales bacterium]|nr:DUF4446 family protein [Candidatus Nanopelagicales bacterium]